MKLDNKGWGLMTFLIIICLLFMVLLLIAYLANQYDDVVKTSKRNHITKNVVIEKELDI